MSTFYKPLVYSYLFILGTILPCFLQAFIIFFTCFGKHCVSKLVQQIDIFRFFANISQNVERI
jgi:hypothetical protein